MTASRPIVLAGFMGAGKTTVGELVAAHLGRAFYDTDRVVEETAGRPVDDFFAAGEEPLFRRLEAEAVASLLDRGPVVIALGGGAMMDARTRALLREHAFLVHLHVPWAQLRPRLPELVANRPLLRGRSTAAVQRLYRSRLEGYAAAELRVVASRRSAAEVAAEVLTAISAARA